MPKSKGCKPNKIWSDKVVNFAIDQRSHSHITTI